MCEDDETKKQGHDAGDDHPEPRRILLHTETEYDPNDSRSGQCDAEEERQH